MKEDEEVESVGEWNKMMLVPLESEAVCTDPWEKHRRTTSVSMGTIGHQ